MRLITWWRLKCPNSCANTASISDTSRRESKRVEKNDPLGLAETGEISIAVIAAARAIHYKKTAGLEAAFPHQLFNTRLEWSIFKRRKFIE